MPDKSVNYAQAVVDVAITGGVLSFPWWRAYLHVIAGTIGDIGVILGVLFLVMRIVHLIVHWKRKPGMF